MHGLALSLIACKWESKWLLYHDDPCTSKDHVITRLVNVLMTGKELQSRKEIEKENMMSQKRKRLDPKTQPFVPQRIIITP